MRTYPFKILSLLILILAFSCSVDELQNNNNLETELQSKNGNSDELSEGIKLYSKQNKASKQESNIPPESISLPCAGVNIHNLYLDMNELEANYNSDPNNPSYTGPFNIFYRNLMATHFTICNVSVSTSTSPSCANVERWIVNLDEYNAYRQSLGLDPVNGNNSSGGTGSSDSTNNSGVTNSDSNTKGSGHNVDTDPDEPTNDILQCFQHN